jgi:hypothetical protein
MQCVICSRPKENTEDEDVNEQRRKHRKIEKREVQRFFTSDRKLKCGFNGQCHLLEMKCSCYFIFSSSAVKEIYSFLP